PQARPEADPRRAGVEVGAKQDVVGVEVAAGPLAVAVYADAYGARADARRRRLAELGDRDPGPAQGDQVGDHPIAGRLLADRAPPQALANPLAISAFSWRRRSLPVS